MTSLRSRVRAPHRPPRSKVVAAANSERIALPAAFVLKPLLASEGAMTKRKATADEERDIRYGRRIANALAGFDVGQSVAIAERACLAVEAMEVFQNLPKRIGEMPVVEDGKLLGLIMLKDLLRSGIL